MPLWGKVQTQKSGQVQSAGFLRVVMKKKQQKQDEQIEEVEVHQKDKLRMYRDALPEWWP